jgi:hypothetical protein
VLAGGRTDYVVSARDGSKPYVVDDKLVFQGRFGVYTVRDGRAEYRYVHDGGRFASLSAWGRLRQARLTGTVVDFTRNLSRTNEIVVDLSGPGPEPGFDIAGLVGSYLHVDTDNVRNGTYRIRGVRAIRPRRYAIDLGDQTLVRGLLDPDDSNGGYTYDIAVGAGWAVPLTHQATATAGQPLDDAEA